MAGTNAHGRTDEAARPQARIDLPGFRGAKRGRAQLVVDADGIRTAGRGGRCMTCPILRDPIYD